MASNQGEYIAILSVHPEYANAILRGEKRVEFRRTRVQRPVEMIAVYSTSPVRRVVAVCHVSEVQEAHPQALWKRHAKCAGIERQRFVRYFAGCERGLAVVLSDTVPLDASLPLSRFSRDLRPPQSFVYISKDRFLAVLEKCCSSSVCTRIGGLRAVAGTPGTRSITEAVT